MRGAAMSRLICLVRRRLLEPRSEPRDRRLARVLRSAKPRGLHANRCSVVRRYSPKGPTVDRGDVDALAPQGLEVSGDFAKRE